MKAVTRQRMSVAIGHEHDFSIFVLAPTKKAFFGLVTIVRHECAKCSICGELVIQRYDLPLTQDARNRLGLFTALRRRIYLAGGLSAGGRELSRRASLEEVLGNQP
jgi:hypothetical protein